MTKRSFALTFAACLAAGRVIGMQTPVTPESALLAHEPVHWRRTLPESLEATVR
jgi:hypothetical protein